MTLTFSEGVNLNDSPTTFSCSSIYGFAATTISCLRTSATTLRVSNVFPNTDKFLIFQISNLKLPGYVSSFTVIASTLTSTNVQVDTSVGNTFKFDSTPGVLQLSLSALTTQEVGSYGNLQVTTILQNQLKSTGYFQMKFPKWNIGTQTLSQVLSMIKYSSSDLQNGLGYKVDCEASGHPNLVCYFTSTAVTQISQISSTFDILKVSGFSSDITTTLQFTIKNNRFRNPSSTKPITSIIVESYNQQGNQIDLQKTQFSFQVTQALSLTSSQVAIEASGETQINKQAQYNIRITTPVPFPIGTQMLIMIPSQIQISSSTSTSQIVLNSAIGFSPLYPVLQVTIEDQSTQKIRLKNLVPFSSNYVDVGTQIQISLIQLVNPSSTANTDAFKIQIYDQEFLMMESNSISINAQPGALTSCTITPDNYRTRKATQYSFSFGISNALQVGSQIKIQMPTQYTIQASTLKLTVKQQLSGSATISYDATTRIILIQNGIPSALQSGTIIKFDIAAGIINPTTTKTTDAFVISTIDSSSNTVDQNSLITITPTPNEIPQVQVMACSNLPSQSYTSQVCTYSLRIYPTINFPIQLNSYIEIELPEELSFSATDIIKYSYSEGLEDSKLTVSMKSSNVIQFKNIFSSSDSSKTQYTLDMFTLYISSITTPRSTQSTGSFKVYIVDSNGFIEYQKISLIQSQVAQARPFERVLVKRSSETNGAQNVTYEFSLIVSLPVFTNEYIKITPPRAISILSIQNQCQGIKGLQTILTCSMKDGSLFVNILPSSDISVNSNKQISAGTLFTFSVRNMQNPLSNEPTESFQVYITTSRVYDYYVNQGIQGLGFLNSFNGELSDVQVLVDNRQLSVSTNYAFYFTTTNIIPSNSYIEVEFPNALYSAFSSSITCQSIRNLPTAQIANSLKCRVSPRNKYVIQVTNGFNNTQLSGGQAIAFRILNIRNPSISSSSTQNQIQVRTMTSNDFVIDSTQNLDFSIGCTYPCSTCNKEATTCSSCVIDDQLNPFYLFQTTCGKTCPSGYYDDKQLKCQKCQFPCSDCMSNSTYCKSCSQQSSLPFIDTTQGKCYQNCPNGMYQEASTKTCEDCVSPCKECTNPDRCLSCENNFFLYNQKCFNLCPNTSVPLKSSQTLECESCKQPCYTCSGSRENCTSCQLFPVTYYFYKNECLEKCPSPYLPNDQNVCEMMDENIFPFLSFILTGSVLIMIFISNRVYQRTRFFTSVLALQSVVMIFLWIYLVIFLLKDKHLSSSGIVLIALILNMALNVFWYLYYKKKILKLDENYQLHTKAYPKTSKAIVFFSFLLTFQLFRLIYTKLFDIKSLSCNLQLKEKFYQKLNRYSLLQITFVYIPIIAANIYNLFFTWEGRQVFWVDIECIFTSIIMLISHTIIIYRTEHQYIIDKYQQQQNNSTTMKTQNGAQNNTTILDTTPRDQSQVTYGENNDNGFDHDKKQRQDALNKIIKKVKLDRDATEILGITADDQILNDKLEDDSIYGFDQLVYGGSNQKTIEKKRINDKQYQSVGITPKTQDKTDKKAQNSHKKNRKKVVDEPTDESYASDQQYNRLQQDSSRDGMQDTQILNELDFTSVPINADKLLKKNTVLQHKFSNFQRELEDLSKNVDKSQRKSPLKKQHITPGGGRNQQQQYHTLGMQGDTDRGNHQTSHADNISEIPASVSGHHLAYNILNKVVANQSSNHDNQSNNDFQTYSAQNHLTPQQVKDQNSNNKPTIHNQADFDEIFRELTGKDSNQADDLEFSIIKKKLDHNALNNMKRDTELQGEEKERQQKLLNQVRSEVDEMELTLIMEQSRKEELQVLIYDLQQSIQSIVNELEEERRKREQELNFIDEANYTSDEEEMGVTPSSYNVLNQRFSDQNDLKIYLNMIGQGEQSRLMTAQGERQGLVEQMEMEPNAANSVMNNGQNSLNTQFSRENSRRSRDGQASNKEGTRSFRDRKMSGKIVPYDNDGNYEESIQSRSSYQQDNDKADDSISMSKEDFLRMLENETKEAIQKMRGMKSKEDQEFAKYAESFLQQMSQDIQGNKQTDQKSLLQYIRELDKRERKKIEEKYRKLFMDTKELKRKIKKKKRSISRTKMPVPNDGNKFDPYFRYLPFEKAVIESNGKTPYDNKQVEMLVKQKSSISEVMSNGILGISPITKRGQSTNKSISRGQSISAKPTKRDSQIDFTKQAIQNRPQIDHTQQVDEEDSQDLFEGLPAENDEKGIANFIENMLL